MADAINEQEVTVQVNHALKDLEEHLIRVWTHSAHLGECNATIQATHFLSRTATAMRQLRADNYDAMMNRKNN